MSTDLEEQKKLLLPILQRAEEIQTVEPRIAYYCRLYAIKKGLEVPKPTKEINGLIKASFAQCERDKPQIQPNAENDRLYCENFALNVFRRADKVDRAGRADMNTCKAFYAAAIFLQVLEQFLDRGDDPEVVCPDLLEKTRYALWRAAEIRKALREGRQPAPPPDIATGAAAAVAGAEGDLFAGPVYEQSIADQADQPQQQQQQQHQQAGVGGAMESTTSSTDDLLDLPKPPSTVPPEGSTGLLPPAAAPGPRFKPGSRVWCGVGPAPEEGTVGMIISPAGGPGGQAIYKVALRSRLEELSDSQLAPAVVAGGRVLYVAAHGDSPVPASVIAANAERWPVTYLLQFDTGYNLDTDAGHISLAAPGADQLAPQQSPQQPASSPTASAAGGGHSLSGMPQPPRAPPLVGPHPPAAELAAAAPHPTPVAPPTPRELGSSYPAIGRQTAAQSAAPAFTGQQAHQHQQQGVTGVSRYPVYPPDHTAVGPPPAAAPQPASVHQAPQLSAGSAFQPSPSAISEAQKYAKYAASSLAFDDVSGGVKYLTDALRLLSQPSAK